MTEKPQASSTKYYLITGAKFAIPNDRPDLMLVELQTAEGPLRFSMSKITALGLAQSIREEAQKLSLPNPPSPADTTLTKN